MAHVGYCDTTGKRQYRSKREAKRVVVSIERAKKGPARFYYCDDCHCYHITGNRYNRGELG